MTLHLFICTCVIIKAGWSNICVLLLIIDVVIDVHKYDSLPYHIYIYIYICYILSNRFLKPSCYKNTIRYITGRPHFLSSLSKLCEIQLDFIKRICYATN